MGVDWDSGAAEPYTVVPNDLAVVESNDNNSVLSYSHSSILVNDFLLMLSLPF